MRQSDNCCRSTVDYSIVLYHTAHAHNPGTIELKYEVSKFMANSVHLLLGCHEETFDEGLFAPRVHRA